MQYNWQGQFAGFNFVADFDYSGHAYRFTDSGGTWVINAVVNGALDKQFVSGYINIGDSSLTGETPYTPAVPEPTTLVLLGTGLAGTARAWRNRKA